MATWKKVIVSGSNAELSKLNIQSNQQISSSASGTFLSGSFSGSFTGDGSQLNNISANVLRVGFTTASVSDTTNRFVVQSGSTNIFTLNGSNSVVLFSEGAANTATGTGSLALGLSSNALGSGSLANGAGTNAEGLYSHAEGKDTRAIGNYSHAEGSGSVALGSFSHAEGLGTIASGSGQTVVGQYNTHNYISASAFIIGNGSGDDNRSNLAVFESSSITFNKPITGSVFSGSFVGDASGLTGIASTLNLSGSFGSGSVNLSSSFLVISGSDNQIQTTASGNTVTIKLANDVIIPNNLTVTNNLIVQGTASFQNTENLQVSDRFILLASGSNAAGDGGLVVQQATLGVGELFGYENSINRWGFTSSFNAAGPLFTATAYVTTTEVGTVAPTAAPAYGGATNGFGNIYVNSNTEEIFIYS